MNNFSRSWPEHLGFWPKKSDFCHTTPIFVDDPFLALDMTVNFPPWKQFFDFSFRSYSRFRKKIRLTAQKVFPPPTVGLPSASNSPSALSAQRAGLISKGWITDVRTTKIRHELCSRSLGGKRKVKKRTGELCGRISILFLTNHATILPN